MFTKKNESRDAQVIWQLEYDGTPSSALELHRKTRLKMRHVHGSIVRLKARGVIAGQSDPDGAYRWRVLENN